MKTTATSTTVVQPVGRTCPRCGVPLGGFGPEGLCPACLLRGGLDAIEEMTTGATAASVFQPHRFGDYELIEEIARGGMGVIYKARQVKLNRMVAVKMILGGQHAGVAELARFRAEAETAARLHHPNIVAIHEVGENEGQPFFSMDFVEGQNLAQLTGNTPLPARRAAEYLRIIAEAVHYAHQQGVLHRDLKPSNVLVDAATDQPQVTDFGLAKRLEGDASLTLTGQVLGSPGFMPPEQAAGKQSEIGLTSDVYSLGAILYHLLTGRPPFVADTVTATLRMVAEAEPISPRLLNASVPRDLETICLKCLRKESSRRYASARELASDLTHILHDEPILARPASSLEKAWRWCRRKPALASALLLVVIVTVGSPIAVVLINRARLRAQTEAAKSAQVAKFLKDMLGSVGPSIAKGQDTTMLREVLDNAAARVGLELTDQPVVQADLQMTLGDVYSELEALPEAEIMFREALRLRERTLGSESLEVAQTLNNFGDVLRRAGELDQAEAVIRRAMDVRKKLLGNTNPAVADSMNNLALVLWQQGKLPAAEAAYREALAINKQNGIVESAVIANLYGNLALVLTAQSRREDAREFHQRALVMKRKYLGKEHPSVALTADNLAQLLRDAGELEEAELMFREALAIRIKILGFEHLHTLGSLGNLTGLLVREQKFVEAENYLASLITPALEGQPQSLNLLRVRGALRLQLGRLPEAITDLTVVVKLNPEDHWMWFQLAPVIAANGNLADYRAHCEKMLARFNTSTNPVVLERTIKACLLLPAHVVDMEWAGERIEYAAEHNDRILASSIQLTRALVEYRKGHYSNAVEWASKPLVNLGQDSHRDSEAFALLAMSWFRLNRPEEVRAALRSCDEIRLGLPTLDSGKLQWEFQKRLVTDILRDEAATLAVGRTP